MLLIRGSPIVETVLFHFTTPGGNVGCGRWKTRFLKFITRWSIALGDTSFGTMYMLSRTPAKNFRNYFRGDTLLLTSLRLF